MKRTSDWLQPGKSVKLAKGEKGVEKKEASTAEYPHYCLD